jgi:hypothetical protein
VYIPLVSGDSLDRDLEWYTLGRRNARDRVSGRIRLSTSWTATQLELMTLNLTQKEQQLAQLEELVAINREIMDEREGGGQALVIQPPFQPLKLKKRGKQKGVAQTKGKEELGQLAVKVVEARHLSNQVSAGMPRLQRTCDAYVVVGCQGVLPGRTAAVHDSFFPVWNETFLFDGVPHSATVKAQVGHPIQILWERCVILHLACDREKQLGMLVAAARSRGRPASFRNTQLVMTASLVIGMAEHTMGGMRSLQLI